MTAAAPPLPDHRVGSTARRQLVLAVLMTFVVVMAGSAVPTLIPRAAAEHVELVVRAVQAAILFGAASLGLLSGRWVARTSVGFACAALLVLAFAGAVSGTAVGQTGFAPVLSTGGAALAVALLLAAAAAPEVNDAASFRRLLVRESGPVALLALVALSPVVDALLMAGMAMPVPVRMVFSVLVATGCLVAGTWVLRLDRPRLDWLPAVMLILSVEVVDLAFVGVWGGSLLVAEGLKALAGAFALVGAAMATRVALVKTTDGMTSMLQDLSAMKDEDSRRRADEKDRLHEIRSVLSGLRAATGSLRKYEDSLDPGVRRRLEDAVGAELSRLNHLIDPVIPEVTQELDLESVVMSVVEAERQQGLLVTTDLADVCVLGSAPDIATLVSDLLVNARLHAPGSAVQLTAQVNGQVVALKVRDWGPGLSAIEATRVFERSYRGARSVAAGVPGSGLGLHNARTLARQMHGDLQLCTPAGGGCCFVATLPLARKRDDESPDALEADWSTDRSQFTEPSPHNDVRAQRTDTRDEELPTSC